jgi:inosose dehydratase
LLAGGDPVQALTDWGERINHLHIKDARLKVIEGIVKERAPVEEVWRRGAFCPLGKGDLDIDEVLARLRARRYRGWLVVEQDTIPNPARPSDEPARDQARNREFLRTRGF